MKKKFSLILLFVTVLFASCQKEDPVILVGGVTLDKNTLPLVVGESEKLIATVLPENASNKNLIWSSGNKAVADVDDKGEVTAKAKGSTTITVMSAMDNLKKAVCTVTVTEPVIYAVGDLYPAAANASGVVFMISDGGAHGKIVSLDQAANKTWTAAQSWTSTNALPAGMSWAMPTRDELQYLWCAYNGAAPVIWGEDDSLSPAANSAAQSAFNKILTDAGGLPILGAYYWSSNEASDGEAWVVGFVGGLTGIDFKNASNLIRVVSSF